MLLQHLQDIVHPWQCNNSEGNMRTFVGGGAAGEQLCRSSPVGLCNALNAGRCSASAVLIAALPAHHMRIY